MMSFSAYRVKIRDRHVWGKWSDFTVVHVDDEEDVYYWLEHYRKVERISAESLSIYKETDIRKEAEIEKLTTYQGYNEGEVYPHDSTITPPPILAIRRRYMKKLLKLPNHHQEIENLDNNSEIGRLKTVEIAIKEAERLNLRLCEIIVGKVVKSDSGGVYGRLFLCESCPYYSSMSFSCTGRYRESCPPIELSRGYTNTDEQIELTGEIISIILDYGKYLSYIIEYENNREHENNPPVLSGVFHDIIKRHEGKGFDYLFLLLENSIFTMLWEEEHEQSKL